MKNDECGMKNAGCGSRKWIRAYVIRLAMPISMYMTVGEIIFGNWGRRFPTYCPMLRVCLISGKNLKVVTDFGLN